MLLHSIGNMAVKEDIGMSMGIDPSPLWANLFLSFFLFESKYIKNSFQMDPLTYMNIIRFLGS